jgi:hypothetical protein
MTRPTVVAAALLLAGAAVLSGCSSSTPAPAATATGIGDWPSFLPSPTAAGAAHGSAANPALSYAGSPVVIATGGGTVTVNVQGPTYPGDTKVGADSVQCTFTVVLSDASAPIALDHARFDVLDHTGQVHDLTPPAGQTVPATVQPGATATFELAATVPSGEGMLRYAVDGAGTAAAWDYVAETD